MSYTCGGATTNDIAVTLQGTIGADNRGVVVAGWWYPTTLTATRGLWSAGDIFGAEIDATTSEIRLRTDNTTDGQWVTSGLGLVVDQWQFLAFFSATENTGPEAAWRVWIGDINTPPRILTPSVSVAPVGNFVGSTAFVLGNKGTGSLAFQGDIGGAVVINAATSTIPGSITRLATSGAITDAEAADVERRIIWPLWHGTPNPDELRWGSGTDFTVVTSIPLELKDMLLASEYSQALTGQDKTTTVNGCTWTENQPPIRLERRWMEKPPQRR